MSSHNLSSFPRCNLLSIKTPINLLEEVTSILDGPQIYIKRDDLNMLGGGGNKLRKLEYYLGDAQRKGANVIIGSGYLQSNAMRLIAAAANRLGLDCELILQSKIHRFDHAFVDNGNVLLDIILGPKLHHVSEHANLPECAERLAAKLSAAGKTPYIIPYGASDALGALGYVHCASEIEEQAKEMNVDFDYAMIANGSSGSQAGLVAGFSLSQSKTLVQGYAVLSNSESTLKRTLAMAQSSLELLGSNVKLTEEQILVDDSALGAGYGATTKEMLEAVKFVAQKEGLFLDPVYSGKAFAGLIRAIKDGKYRREQKILFISSGGEPGLFAYRSEFNHGLMEDGH